jgi:hypothetical protein
MAFELIAPAEGEDRWKFAIAPDAVAVSFLRDEVSGEVNLLRLFQSGMIMDAPRKGTALAEEMGRPPVVDPATVEKFIGLYRQEPAGDEVRITVVGNILTATLPRGVTFKLQPSKDNPLNWAVWNLRSVEVTFNLNDAGDVVSFTRRFGGDEVVLKKIVDEPPM